MNIIYFNVKSYFNENNYTSLMLVIKIGITISVSISMILVYFYENKNRNWILFKKITKMMKFGLVFVLCFLEINFLIIFELEFYQEKSDVFLQTVFVVSKIFILNGFVLEYKIINLAFLIIFNIFFIFLNKKSVYRVEEISLVIMQCLFTYIILILPKLRWFKLINQRRQDKTISIESICKQLFLIYSEPAFIIKKIAEKEKEYSLILINKNAESLFCFNKLSGKLDFNKLNNRFQEIFLGYKGSSSIKSSQNDRLKEETREMISESQQKPELSDLILDFLSDEDGKKTIEVYLRNLNSEESNHYEVEFFKFNESKDKVYFAFLIHDLKKRDESQNIRHLNEANNRLFCSLSHELKTPINGALPSLEMVKSKLASNELIKLLDISIGSLKLLDNSLSNILDYYLFQTKQVILNKKEFALVALVNELMEIIIPMIEVKNLEFKLDFPYEIHATIILSDYVKLKQILLNLLTNAIQFTFKGHIKFKISQSCKDNKIFNFLIEDSGIGIEEEKLINILKKIKESDQENIKINSTGSCMGLLISEKIAMLLGNYDGLSIVSEFEKGSTFSFRINSEIDFHKYSEKLNSNEFKLFSKSSDLRLQTTNTLIQNSGLIEEKRKFNRSRITRNTLMENHNSDSFISRTNRTQNAKGTNNAQNHGTFEEASPNNSYNFAPFVKPLHPNNIHPISDVSSVVENDSVISNTSSSYLKLSSLKIKLTLDRSEDFIIDSNCDCETILCVDDDAFNLLSLEMILKSFNLKCCKAMNGIAAIEELKKKSCSFANCNRFRLIFMDYQMPLMDGVEATEKIRELIFNNVIKETTIIGCTAFVSKDEVLKCYDAGMKDVIFKPLNKNIIKSVLKEWMEYE